MKQTFKILTLAALALFVLALGVAFGSVGIAPGDLLRITGAAVADFTTAPEEAPLSPAATR